jgi:competence protein ComEC
MLITLALAWLAAVGFGLLLPNALPALLAAAAAAALLTALGPPTVRRAAPACAFAALGAARLLAAQTVLAPPDLSPFAGRDLVLIGTLREEPRRSDRDQRAVLQVSAVASPARPNQHLPLSGRVQLSLPAFPVVHYGQQISVAGRPELPGTAQRPGDFDYRAYLARRGVHLLLREVSAVTIVAQTPPFDPLGRIAAAREHCRLLLLRLLPEPQSALAIGILLGIQAGLPPELQEQFSITGTSHILVVSGWNFSIAAAALAAVTRALALPRWPAFVLSLSVMWAYAVFTGASAAVLRAAAMASLALLAVTVERQGEAWRLLLGACLLLTAVDPLSLADLGFQLSALATASLFAFAAPLDTALKRLPLPDHPLLTTLRETLSATLAAQVLTMPLLLHQFGSLSLIAPLANLVIVPVVPLAMAAAAAALVAGLLLVPLGQLLGVIAWLPLSWIAHAAELLAAPGWAAVDVPPFPAAVLLPIYLLLALLTWHRTRLAAQPSVRATMPPRLSREEP